MSESAPSIHAALFATPREMAARFGMPLQAARTMLKAIGWLQGDRPGGEWLLEGETFLDRGAHLKAADRWQLNLDGVEHEMWNHDRDDGVAPYKDLLLKPDLGVWSLMSAQQRLMEAVFQFRGSLPGEAQRGSLETCLGELEFELTELAYRLAHGKGPGSAIDWMDENAGPILRCREDGTVPVQEGPFNVACSKVSEIIGWLRSMER